MYSKRSIQRFWSRIVLNSIYFWLHVCKFLLLLKSWIAFHVWIYIEIKGNNVLNFARVQILQFLYIHEIFICLLTIIRSICDRISDRVDCEILTGHNGHITVCVCVELKEHFLHHYLLPAMAYATLITAEVKGNSSHKHADRISHTSRLLNSLLNDIIAAFQFAYYSPKY